VAVRLTIQAQVLAVLVVVEMVGEMLLTEQLELLILAVVVGAADIPGRAQ
jgi:hypothetical protein